MKLDTYARASAEALREATRGVATDESFDALVRASRRRTAERTAAVVACAALVAAGLAVGLRDQTEPQPAAPHTQGTIVSDLSAPGGTGTGLIGFDRGGQTDFLSALADGEDLVNPADLAVSSNGASLALVGRDRVQVVDLESETLRATIPCEACMWVEWWGDERLDVTSFPPGREQVTRVYERDGTLVGRTTIPRGVWPDGYSPDRSQVVGVEQVVGQEGLWRLFVQDAQGGGRYVLKGTLTQPDWSIRQASWSPRGDQVAYVLSSPPTGPSATRSYQLMVARVDGTDVTRVADLGECSCFGASVPTFSWSPDGGALAASRVGMEREDASIVVFGLDGRVEREVHGSSPVEWIAAD